MDEMNDVTGSIDWQALAQRLDKLNQYGGSVDKDSERRAIEMSLGENDLQTAVDYCVSDKSSSETARLVLQQLHPWPAMQRCYQLFLEGDSETRRSAVELLQIIADQRALPWISEFLEDTDPLVQYLGAEILDQLVWSGSVKDKDCSDLIEKIREHPNAEVRAMASLIWSPSHNRAYAH
jgi:HEAT repeat protein